MAADTPHALIEAGRRLFAQAGYEGTSVRAIAADAGANLGAITYHFGSKRELYDRVVESVVTPLADRVEEAVRGSGDVLDRAGHVVRAYFDYFALNPDLPQLMMQELSLAGVPPEVIAQPLRRVHGLLTAMIEEGQRRGEVRAGPPQVLSIFIISVPVHLGMLHRAISAHMGLNVLQPPLRDAVMSSAIAFVRSGLRAETQ